MPSPTTGANAVQHAHPPVVIGERSLRALLDIRHDWLLRDMFGTVLLSRSAADALDGEIAAFPEWVRVHDDPPPNVVTLPERLISVGGTDRETIRLALALNARLVILEGKGLLEKVKLSFLKAQGVVPLLVQAYQNGRIRRIKPLLTALERKGHEMPPPEQMEALLRALDELG